MPINMVDIIYLDLTTCTVPKVPAMNIKECFEILELRVDATLEQVQKAYRTLMMVCHPDNQRHNKIDLRLI